MERIQIIGCSGAGKSTLARQLGKKTGLPVVHIDRLFWKSGWVESTKEEIDRKILAAMEEEHWIIDGNYTRTLPQRLERCDLVVYLDFPTWFCILSILWRYVTNIGKVRPDMAEGCPEKVEREFLNWVWNYNKSKRPMFYQLFETMPRERVVILKNRRAVKKFLQQF